MPQGFKLRFEQMREGDPTQPEGENAPAQEELKAYYDQPGQMRDVCFVWPDGTRLAMSYSYLVSKKLTVSGEMNGIMLVFTSETVTIKGYNLTSLHTALMEQRALYIAVEESRYTKIDSEAEQTNVCTVLEIALTKAE